MKQWSDLQVGDTVWVFDVNRRVYAPARPGRLWADGGPIYREHFRPVVIESETSRSWVTVSGTKYSKKDRPHGIYIDQQEIDDACWVNDHRYKVSSLVDRCQDPAILRQIAALVGYEETK